MCETQYQELVKEGPSVQCYHLVETGTQIGSPLQLLHLAATQIAFSEQRVHKAERQIGFLI